jgi:tripartite-type tricarboxylate transporter receptor subunit TctC
VITRRRALATGGTLLAAPLLARPRCAAADVPVSLLVGAAAGTAADTLCRAVAPLLARHLGEAIEVRNIPGEAGLNALTALADAPPTGATLGWVSAPNLPARMVDHAADALLPRLTLLGAVEREPVAFVSPAATPIDSVPEIIRRSGEDADAVPLGTPPAGSPPHLAALRLQLLAQTRLNIVTFPSASAAVQAVTDGNVAAASIGLSDAFAGLRDGSLVGLGITSRNRADLLPDLPAVNEAGLPLATTIRRGLAVPAGVSATIADRLGQALQALSGDPEFRDQANSTGFLAVWIDGAAWKAQIEAERVELGKLWDTEPWLHSGGG